MYYGLVARTPRLFQGLLRSLRHEVGRATVLAAVRHTHSGFAHCLFSPSICAGPVQRLENVSVKIACDEALFTSYIMGATSW